MTHVFRVNLPEGSKTKHATSTQRFLAWPSTAIPLFDSDFLGVYFIVSSIYTRKKKRGCVLSNHSAGHPSIVAIWLGYVRYTRTYKGHCSWTCVFKKITSLDQVSWLVHWSQILLSINPISIPCSVLIIRALIAILIFGTSIYELIAMFPPHWANFCPFQNSLHWCHFLLISTCALTCRYYIGAVIFFFSLGSPGLASWRLRHWSCDPILVTSERLLPLAGLSNIGCLSFFFFWKTSLNYSCLSHNIRCEVDSSFFNLSNSGSDFISIASPAGYCLA